MDMAYFLITGLPCVPIPKCYIAKLLLHMFCCVSHVGQHFLTENSATCRQSAMRAERFSPVWVFRVNAVKVSSVGNHKKRDFDT